MIISGNHDSDIRLSAYSSIMDNYGIHIAPEYKGDVKPVVLTDDYGDINFYMLPFVKPINVRAFFPEDSIKSYTDALDVAIKNMNIDKTKRNVLVTHQFVTGALRSDSEEVSVGGTDNVDASVFEDFNYVALGHIHGPQSVTKDTIRYCGTPLKYSFSEKDHKKSVTIVDIDSEGKANISESLLTPIRDMREIRGLFEDIVSKKNYEGTSVDDYIKVILTDEEEINDAMAKLRVIYPNIMKYEYDNKRTRSSRQIEDLPDVENKSELELFAELFEIQNGQEMSEEQIEYVTNLFESIKEEEE